MHELSVAAAVLDTVLKHADERPVSVVGVSVGPLRQVVPESLRFYFEIVARDTPAQGARLDLVATEPCLRCRDCGHEWNPDWALFRCPSCSSPNTTVLSGDELQVDYIEVENKEPACIGPR
jgi:hydrogenase nickel incorporation protein HypA/HybF